MSERKISRRIYGPTQEGERWRPRRSSELYILYNEPNIVEDIKIRRLGWAGHIISKEEEIIPKKVLNGNFYTTRPVGRPRTRWAEVVQRDALQLLGTGGWRRRAENRDERMRLIGEPRPGRSCSTIYGMGGIIIIIIGATGTISKSFRKYVSNIPGQPEVKELQKTAILGTAHILRKVLM